MLLPQVLPSSSSLFLSILELSDTAIYEPYIRAFLGTAPQFCTAVVLESPVRVVAHKRCTDAEFPIKVSRAGSAVLFPQVLPPEEQIVFFNCIGVYHKPPDSGER